MNIPALVQRQRDFFRSGATYPPSFRRAQLRRLEETVVAHESSLLAALAADLGKSAHEGYAGEVGFLLAEIRFAIRHLAAWVKPHRRRTPPLAWPARAFLRPEPYGVTLIIGPWNYPVQLLLTPLVGALAAGNCVILKPSEFASRTGALIADLIGKSFASDQVAVALGERDTAEALLRERFDKIFFTGSSAVGRTVMTAAARTLTPVTLELGGKCPCLVCADAPIEATARRIVWGKFMNAGQTCVAPDFVWVDRRARAALVEAMTRVLHQFYGNDPRQSPDYGRIVNQKHFDRLLSYLNQGRVAHGGKSERGDLYLAPTLLTDVPADAPVMQEEIFGPILPVLDFAELEQVLRALRDRPIPLALYLFTRDRAIQARVLAETRSGGVGLNDPIMHMIGRDLPFGGLGESGMGAYHGRASFDCFTHYRPILRRGFWLDSHLRYPPPRVSLSMLRCAFRFLLGR